MLKDLLRIAGLPDDFGMEYAEGNQQYFRHADGEEV